MVDLDSVVGWSGVRYVRRLLSFLALDVGNDPVAVPLRALCDPRTLLDADATALDLDDSDSETGRQHQNIDLNVFVITGQPLTVDHRRLIGELFAQGNPHGFLGGGSSEIRLLWDQHDHGLSLPR